MKFYSKLSNHYQGIFFTILSCFFASVLVSLVRHLSTEFHIFFIVMVRNFFGLLFFLPQILRSPREIFSTKKPVLHLFRGLNGLASMFSWFYVLTLLPLSEAVSISFIIPIITTVAAVVFLKEKVTSKTWIAIATGFIGILIILRPGFREFKTAYLFSFLSIFLWLISNLLIKVMTRSEKPKTIVANMSLIMMLFSIPFALPYMKAINFENFLYFALLGLVSNLTHMCIATSYSKVDLSVLQPFDFMRLIFTAIISYFAFGEIIDFWVVIGSLVILFGVIISAPKKKAPNIKTIAEINNSLIT